MFALGDMNVETEIMELKGVVEKCNVDGVSKNYLYLVHFLAKTGPFLANTLNQLAVDKKMKQMHLMQWERNV